MINKKKAAILVGVLTILAVAAIFLLLKSQAAAQAQNPEPRPQPAVVGQPMPDFTLPVYQGGTLTLSSLRGTQFREYRIKGQARGRGRRSSGL